MNIFKKLLMSIKIIFNKNKYNKQIIEKKEEVKKLEQELNEIKEEVVEEKANLKELLEELKVGDIIWAKRYKNRIEEEEIPEQHKEGPFIVIEKVEEGLICIYGTGTAGKNDNINFILNNYEYSLKKETNFILFKFKLIDNNSFIRKLDELTPIDKNRLYKKLKKLNMKYYYVNDERKSFRFPFQIGDIIIKNNNKYIIVDINDNKLFCIPLKVSTKDLKFTDFKSLDYSKLTIFDKNNNYKILNIVDNKIIMYVLNEYKKYLNNLKNINITQRGSVIKKGNKFYYIYGEEGQDWLIFEISENKFEDAEQLIINNKKFYTDFSKVLKINKKILLANQCEKDMISGIKKNHSKHSIIKQQKNIQKEPEVINFNIGDIVQYKKERFFVITVCSEFCECLSINELKQCIKNKKFLRKQDIKKINYNQIKGIKWLEENPDFDIKDIYKEEIIEKIINVQRQYVDIKLIEQRSSEFQKKL